MINQLVQKLFGTKHERELKKMQPLVAQIGTLEKRFEKLSDDELRGHTASFKERIAKGEALDQLLPEAFATVRVAGVRALGMRHYDVQLIGGVVMHRGRIAEMKTGEGKTLTATLAMYLNALPGKGAHLVTVNDYLASRDAEWMGELYGFLGMQTGSIVSGMAHAERKAAYACDITYGTNEFGFDYLRDNMVPSLGRMVQRGLHYAIVDEVDSILIDENHAAHHLGADEPHRGRLPQDQRHHRRPDPRGRLHRERGAPLRRAHGRGDGEGGGAPRPR